MAYDDLLMSCNRASKILVGHGLEEGEIPQTEAGLVRLKDELWARVSARNKAKRKHTQIPPFKEEK